MPGIFFWVLLVVNPFTRDKPEGRFIKGMIAASIIGMGLIDYDTVIVTLKGFIAVQKWLECVPRDDEGSWSARLTVSHRPKDGLPTWSITE